MSANYVHAVRDAIGLKGTEKCVAMILVAHRNYKTGQCNLSYDTIAAKAGFKRSAVIRAIAALVARGLMTKRSRKTTAGDQTSNQYDFHFEAWFALDKSSEHRGAPDTPPSEEKGGVPDTPPGVSEEIGGVRDTPPGCTTRTLSSSLRFLEDKKEVKGVSFDSQKQETQKPTSKAGLVPPSLVMRTASQRRVSPSIIEAMVREFRGSPGTASDDYAAWNEHVTYELELREGQKTALQSGKAKPKKPERAGYTRGIADIAGSMGLAN